MNPTRMSAGNSNEKTRKRITPSPVTDGERNPDTGSIGQILPTSWNCSPEKMEKLNARLLGLPMDASMDSEGDR